MSAAGSRRTMNAVRVPGRTLICVIWPSTHTLPSRSIQPATLVATVRTGQGSSAVLGPPRGGRGSTDVTWLVRS